MAVLLEFPTGLNLDSQTGHSHHQEKTAKGKTLSQSKVIEWLIEVK